MLETCNSCGTVFDVDENILSNKIEWLRCSVCNEKWSVTKEFDKNIYKSEIENKKNIVLKQTKFKDKSEQVKYELASIKAVVEDKTKNMSKKNNPVLEQKNKSVAEIASELSESKLKIDQPNQFKTNNKADNSKVNNKKSLLPFCLFMVIAFLFGSLIFRSALLGFSVLYFPKSAENYMPKINELLNYIKFPIMAELAHINLTNFVATFQDEEVTFSGTIKNISNRPILVPRVKILAVREDRKIILEQIIILKDKIILPVSEIKFSEIVKMKRKKENVSVKVTLLTKIYDL